MKFEYLSNMAGFSIGFPLFGFYPLFRLCFWDLYEFCLFRIKIMSRACEYPCVSVLEVACLSFSIEIGYQENV